MSDSFKSFVKFGQDTYSSYILDSITTGGL